MFILLQGLVREALRSTQHHHAFHARLIEPRNDRCINGPRNASLLLFVSADRPAEDRVRCAAALEQAVEHRVDRSPPPALQYPHPIPASAPSQARLGLK